MLRPAQISDLATATSWASTAQECEFWAGSSQYFPFDLATLPQAFGMNPDNTFAFIEGDGLAAFGQVFDRGGGRAHLARIAVNPALRGKGYGRIFVQALIDRARAEGFGRVSLNVNDQNPAAIALYQKLGFQKATRPEGQAPWPSASYMELVL